MFISAETTSNNMDKHLSHSSWCSELKKILHNSKTPVYFIKKNPWLVKFPLSIPLNLNPKKKNPLLLIKNLDINLNQTMHYY